MREKEREGEEKEKGLRCFVLVLPLVEKEEERREEEETSGALVCNHLIISSFYSCSYFKLKFFI